MLTSEKAITKRIMDYLRSQPDVKAIKIVGSVSQERGTPDIAACVCGRMLLVEVKQPTGRLSKLQEARIKQWRKVGACVIVAYDVPVVRVAVEKLRTL